MAAAANLFEQGARLVKALALADLLDGAGIKSRRAASMDSQQWEMLAAAAAVQPPSDETRSVAVTMLRAREGTRKRLASLRRRSKDFAVKR
jgi:hypothetical protein